MCERNRDREKQIYKHNYKQSALLSQCVRYASWEELVLQENNFLFLLRNFALRGKPILLKVWQLYRNGTTNQNNRLFFPPLLCYQNLSADIFFFTYKQIILRKPFHRQTDRHQLTHTKQKARRVQEERKNKWVKKKKTTKSKTARREALRSLLSLMKFSS